LGSLANLKADEDIKKKLEEEATAAIPTKDAAGSE
jgi:hypothetical protein